MLPVRTLRPFGNFLILDDLIKNAKAEIDNLTSAVHVDIVENKENFQVFANLPGVSKENVDVNIKGGLLTISIKAEKQNWETEYPRERVSFLLRERRKFKATRTFNFGNKATENVKAVLENGVLVITISKVDSEDLGKKIPLD